MSKLNSGLLLFRSYVWLADQMKDEAEQITALYTE